MNTLDLDYLVELYDIVSETSNSWSEGITITESAMRIVFVNDFKRFLERSNFKFRDVSSLTIPKFSSERHR